MNKQFYLKKFDALRDVIEQLPEDVSIVRIYDDYVDGKDLLCLQIGDRNGLTPDRTERLACSGFLWAEKDFTGLYGTQQATITVGWVVHEEGNDDDL